MPKKIVPILLAAFCIASLGAQTTIDKPAATIKLTRQEVISMRQIRTDVERLEKTTGLKFTADQIKDVLNARINSMLFVQFCEKEKILVDKKEIEQALAQMTASISPKATIADLEASLRSNGVFVEPEVYVRQRILFERYVDTKRAAELKAARVPPTADEILKAYDLAKASLVRPDTVRLSVLYVDTRGKSDADAAKLKDTLQAISGTLKVNPAKFDELILRSGDAAGYKSIASLYVQKTAEYKTMFGAEFFDAVFKLKTGEISGMIASPTGFRIVRSNEFLAQKQLGLSDTVPGNQNMTVQEFLAYQLASEKESAFMDKLEAELIAKLRTDASIKIFEENLKW
jgi:parvulin-like peptidyl-prolyl isomerase